MRESRLRVFSEVQVKCEHHGSFSYPRPLPGENGRKVALHRRTTILCVSVKEKLCSKAEL